jgi:phage recombination protein Bet
MSNTPANGNGNGPPHAATAMAVWSAEQVNILRQTLAPTLTDAELGFFAEVCERTRLDPFKKQIYVQKRKTRDGDRLVFITAIDGYRSIAADARDDGGQRLYEGQTPAQWCGEDGVWKDVWLSGDPPAAARVGVYRKGFRETIWGVARYDAYVQTAPIWGQNKGEIVGHKPVEMWVKMPDNQLAKCAEALALRKAFPERLSAIRTKDEMAQAENEVVPVAMTAKVAVATETVVAQEKLANDFRVGINGAKTVEDLQAVAVKLGRSGLPKPMLDILNSIGKTRMRELQSAKPETDPLTGEVIPPHVGVSS